jgi:copper oxidase (laccase) domain-containing protein
VRDAFIAHDREARGSFVPTAAGRWLADLYALARRRLAAAGVGDVSGGRHCTYEEEALFFSHRRDVQHRGLAGTGRMAALIWRQT